MRNIVSVCCAVCLLFLTGTAGATERKLAEPTSVIFYPNEAQLTFEVKITPEHLGSGSHGFYIPIPANAKRDTFFVTLDGKNVTAYSWNQLPKKSPPLPQTRGSQPGEYIPFSIQSEPLPFRRALLEKVHKLETEAHTLEQEIEACKIRLELWEKRYTEPSQPTPVDDQIKLDAELEKKLPALLGMIHSKNAMLNDTRILINLAKEELANFDQTRFTTHVIIPYTGNVKQPVTLQYGYVVPASFSSSYALNAKPKENAVVLDQFATLTQMSGTTWSNVDVTISTGARSNKLSPSTIAPWIVSSQPIVSENESRQKNRAQGRMMAMEAKPDFDASNDEQQNFAPVVEQRSIFRIWKLGKQTLDSGTPTRVTLESTEHPAEFYYTLRPSLHQQGFLTADITFSTSQELPTGAGQFYVDGMRVGEQTLNLNGRKAQLFFAADPLVTARMNNLENVQGEKGLINREQTKTWDWEIIVENNHDTPIRVQVEDAAPRLTNSKTNLVVNSTPKAEEVVLDAGAETKAYIWKFPVEPQNKKTISHKVVLSTPTDIPVYFGR